MSLKNNFDIYISYKDNDDKTQKTTLSILSKDIPEYIIKSDEIKVLDTWGNKKVEKIISQVFIDNDSNYKAVFDMLYKYSSVIHDHETKILHLAEHGELDGKYGETYETITKINYDKLIIIPNVKSQRSAIDKWIEKFISNANDEHMRALISCVDKGDLFDKLTGSENWVLTSDSFIKLSFN